MNQIDISIIVPIYNVELYLEKCIRSILNQTFQNFELILVNDGSTDSSREICNEFAQKDERIKVIHKENGGVSSARNAGLKIATGKYIGFVDPDDYIFSDMFLNLYKICEKTNSDISICRNTREINGDLIEIKNSTTFLKEMTCEEALTELFLAKLYRFALWNKLFKRKCFEGIEFPENRIHEDLSVTYLLISKADKVCYTNYIGYVYVKRSESILTTQYNEKRLQSLLAWKEIILFMNNHFQQLNPYVKKCLMYWITDNINYILVSNNNKSEKLSYLKTIQYFLKENKEYIFSIDCVPFYNKFLLKCLYLAPHFILMYWNIKNIKIGRNKK